MLMKKEESYQSLWVFNKIESVKNYFLAKIFSLKYQTVKWKIKKTTFLSEVPPSNTKFPKKW